MSDDGRDISYAVSTRTDDSVRRGRAAGSPFGSSRPITVASETIRASVMCSFSLRSVLLIVLGRFDAAAVSEGCSIIMIGPHDEPGVPVFGYYGKTWDGGNQSGD